MNEHSEIAAGDGMDTIASRMMTNLRNAIVRLDLKPGDTISEAEVAERFGVSRQPVREAFIRLGQQGLLLIRPKRATMVKRISEDGVGQSRFIREAIEVEIIRRAAAARTAATGPMLEAILVQQNEAASAGDIGHFHTLDETFHRALAQTAGVEYAWQLIDDHKIQLDRVRYLTLPRSDAADDRRAPGHRGCRACGRRRLRRIGIAGAPGEGGSAAAPGQGRLPRLLRIDQVRRSTARMTPRSSARPRRRPTAG